MSNEQEKALDDFIHGFLEYCKTQMPELNTDFEDLRYMEGLLDGFLIAHRFPTDVYMFAHYRANIESKLKKFLEMRRAQIKEITARAIGEIGAA